MNDWRTTLTRVDKELSRRGMSIARFCRKAEIDRSTYDRLVKGKFAPRQDTLARITKAIAEIKADPASPPRVKPKPKPAKKKAAHKMLAAT